MFENHIITSDEGVPYKNSKEAKNINVELVTSYGIILKGLSLLEELGLSPTDILLLFYGDVTNIEIMI